MANAQGVLYNKKVFADAGITDLPKTPDTAHRPASRIIRVERDRIRVVLDQLQVRDKLIRCLGKIRDARVSTRSSMMQWHRD